MIEHPWNLPPILDLDRRRDAADLLADYFHVNVVTGIPDFTGSRFERFAGGGDRPAVADVITAEDVVAVTMLSVDVPAAAALKLLGDRFSDHAEHISALLHQLPVDVSLSAATDTHLEIASQLWTEVRHRCGVGPTTTSKLLARKRPHLLPVIDSVVRRQLGHGRRRDFYETLRAHLRDDAHAMDGQLSSIRREAAIGNDISIIRCFDIILWMDGTQPLRTRQGERQLD
jgi:hypothetical protein